MFRKRGMKEGRIRERRCDVGTAAASISGVANTTRAAHVAGAFGSPYPLARVGRARPFLARSLAVAADRSGMYVAAIRPLTRRLSLARPSMTERACRRRVLRDRARVARAWKWGRSTASENYARATFPAVYTACPLHSGNARSRRSATWQNTDSFRVKASVRVVFTLR